MWTETPAGMLALLRTDNGFDRYGRVDADKAVRP
jgi:hypothetical protein